MAAHITRLTRKGQVTIPVEIRRALRLNEGDHVSVEREGSAIVIRRSGSVAARTAGVLATYRRQPTPSAQDEREAFERAVAEEVIASMERS